MINRRKVTLGVIVLLMLLCTAISMSYAWYRFAVGEELELSTTIDIPTCAYSKLDVVHTGGINLSGDNAAPISDAKALSSEVYRYKVSVVNNCSTNANLQIALAPDLNSSMPDDAIKYAVVPSGEATPSQGNYLTDLEKKRLTDQIIAEAKSMDSSLEILNAYELFNTTMASGTTKDYYIYIWIDEYEGDRTKSGKNNNITMNKTFGAHIVVSDYEANAGSGTLTLAESIVDKSGKEYVSSADSGIYRVANQNGYRYEGSNPDNYIEFNGELWRIIGSFEGSSIGLKSGKYYTKIARANVLDSTMAWNTTTALDWPSSSLKTYLNGEYYNSLDKTSQGMIVNATWYLGTVGGTSYENLTTPGWYDAERGTLLAQSGTSLTDKGKISLIYASDWGYAMYTNDKSTECDNTTTLLAHGYGRGYSALGSSYYRSCYKYDWLTSDSTQWLLNTRYENYSAFMLIPENQGSNIITNTVSSYTMGIRPTLYLDANVYIKSGSGSESNPYKLTYDNPTLSDQILALHSGEDYTSTQDGSPYRVTEQNGIRFEGYNPDNFVTFNGETWRIIGAFEGSTIGLQEGKYYTKIMNVTTNISWMDWGSDNNWSNSTLYNYLNNTYYDSISTDEKEFIANAKWHLGGAPAYAASSYTTSQFYQAERGTVGANNAKDSSKLSVYAKLGLMYLSDWGYSMYAGSENTTCDNRILALNDYSFGCGYDYSWIPNMGSPYWALNVVTDNSNQVFYLGSGDDISVRTVDSTSYSYPVLYLDSNVYITSGSGTSVAPYQLAINRTLSEQILADNTAYADNVSSEFVSSETGIDFMSSSSDTNGKGLYYTSTNTENNGTTYYFRGDVDNNYVKFGKDSNDNDIVWRIVRINEDGSVRLMLNTTISADGYYQSTDMRINNLVGYMRGDDSATSYEEAHANINSSPIKLSVDNWYINETNLSQYSNDYLADAGFCNDRSVSPIGSPWPMNFGNVDTGRGYGFETTLYGPGNRVENLKKPQLKCPQKNDLFTLKGGKKGNKALDYPVGLITVDEALYIGLGTASYLYTGSSHWTMSPEYYGEGNPSVYIVTDGGEVDGKSDNSSDTNARPVINLAADVIVADGDGTSSNPYVLKVETEPETLSNEVISKVSSNAYTSSQTGGQVYLVNSHSVTYNGTTYDAGVRYSGLDPDNYVKFNGEELWRIIGVFEGSTIGLEPGKQYTKIIGPPQKKVGWKLESEYDSGVLVGDWNHSSMKTYLNGTYLTALQGQAKIATYNGEYSTWYLRGGSNKTSANDYYTLERVTGTPGYYQTSSNVGDPESKDAIALMYASDFGYASYSSTCNSFSITNECNLVNWLATNLAETASYSSNYEYILAPSGSTTKTIYYYEYNGTVTYSITTIPDDYVNYNARPTLYLEHDITIASGTGSESNPYILN